MTTVHLLSGRGSLRLTRVGVIVDVGVCNVSVVVLGELYSTATCQLCSQIDADRLSGKLRRQQLLPEGEIRVVVDGLAADC